jgi:hypothetical protein
MVFRSVRGAVTEWQRYVARKLSGISQFDEKNVLS